MEALSILVVDDSEFVGMAAKVMLETLGHDQVSYAMNGKEALTVMSGMPVDIVFLDLNMPEVDGIQVITQMNAISPNTSLAVMSGSDRSILDAASAVVKSSEVNLLGVFEKPFTIEVVQKVIENYDAIKRAKPKVKAFVVEKLSGEQVADALYNDRICLHYQPKIDIRTNAVVGVEALARICDVDGAIYYPGSFLEEIERSNLGQKLTQKVTRAAFRDLAIWKSAGLDISLSINVSSYDLDDPTFADFLIDEANTAGIDLSEVIIEVTEHRILSNIGTALGTLARLRMKKAEVSIDDFGTGASTLQQIKQLPCTELKVDKVFVHEAHVDSRSQKLFSSCVALGNALDLRIVAEGVETEADLQFAKDLGVNIIQGFYFSKGLALDDMMAYCVQQNNAS